MSDKEDMRGDLRQKAVERLDGLSPQERESLLIKNWMSHDARWFMAVARDFGIAATNRINQTAAHELGKVEAQRLVRALQLPPVETIDDYLLAQEIFTSILGPDLLDYRVVRVGEDAYRLEVNRCFAHENAVKAGIADQYDCGILPRVTGWLHSLGVKWEISPAIDRCLKCQGCDCAYTIAVRAK
jgi:hypothetical protein